jgi:hypothetical protein
MTALVGTSFMQDERLFLMIIRRGAVRTVGRLEFTGYTNETFKYIEMRSLLCINISLIFKALVFLKPQ